MHDAVKRPICGVHMKWHHLVILGFALPITSIAQENTSQKNVAGVAEVLPDEDLMREHGVLNRLLLIYQEIAQRLDNFEPFPLETLTESAQLVRNFLEDYHEKLEEEFVFSKFQQSGKMVQLVKILREQHDAGRHLTDYILSHTNKETLRDDIQRMLLSDYLKLYVRMFRPHEAREDTVLFPEFKKLVTPEEYKKLGEVFEDREHDLFGEKGFADTVKKVAEIEKKLKINNLKKFTPKTP